MKIVAKSSNGKFLKLGKDQADAKFYGMSPSVMKVIGSFTLGEEVQIKTVSENGSLVIVDITKAGATPTPAPEVKQEPKQEKEATNGSNVGGGSGFAEKPAEKAPYLPREEWEAKMKAEGKWKEPGAAKSPAEQNTIKRQAIGHMTSRSLASMHGLITPDNIEEIITKLYAKYTELVG